MIQNSKIPPQVFKAIELLNKGGFEAYLVGGSVRDLLQNKTPSDFDLTTSATPEQSTEIFKEYPVIPVGFVFGTIIVVLDQMPIEITTYRIEQEYSDFRRPDIVEFTTDLISDLSRRDFTINAIAYHPTTGIEDPFSGYEDIKNKIIRTVGNPKERFSEDALRILRALRFASILGFNIEKNTKNAIHSLKLLLLNIARERINQEFSQIMTSTSVKNIFLEYRDVIAVFIPDLKETFDFEQKNPYHEHDIYRHTIEVICNTPSNLDLRLAALYHDIGKPQTFSIDADGIGHFYQHPKISAIIAKKNMYELKFEKKLIETVEKLVLYHDYPLELNEVLLKKRLHKFGEEILKKLIVLKKADIIGKTKSIQDDQINYLNEISLLLDRILITKPALQITDLEINGYDAIDLGLKGRQIGNALNQILDLVLTNKLENKREPQLEALQKIIDLNKLS